MGMDDAPGISSLSQQEKAEVKKLEKIKALELRITALTKEIEEKGKVTFPLYEYRDSLKSKLGVGDGTRLYIEATKRLDALLEEAMPLVNERYLLVSEVFHTEYP